MGKGLRKNLVILVIVLIHSLKKKTKNSFSISWIVTKLTYLSQEKQNYASEKI